MSQFYDLNIQGSEVQLRLDLASHNVLAFDGILDVPVVASDALITEAGTYQIVYAPNGGRGEMLLSMGGVYYRHFKLQSEGKTVLDSSWYNTDGQIRKDRLFLNGAARDIYAYAAGAFGKVERDGVDGITPHIDPATRHWMIGEADTGVLARGTDGESAYQTAVNEGFQGTQSEWIASLHGLNGKSAYELWVEQPGNEGKSVSEFLASLKESGFSSKAVLELPTGSNIEENTIYAVPEKSNQELADPDMWAEYIRKNNSWLLLALHDGGGLSSIISDVLNLQGRDEPIVFTESKTLNSFVKTLYIDASKYNGEGEIQDMYAFFFVSGDTKYLAIYDAPTGGNRLIYVPISSYLDEAFSYGTENGMFFYLEIDRNSLPTTTVARTKVTTWATSKAFDPRKTDGGYTDSPILNKYIKKLWIEFPADYILPTGYSSIEQVKSNLCLYSLNNNNVDNGIYKPKLYFRLFGSGNQFLQYDNQDGILGEITLKNSSNVILHAVIDWNGMVGKRYTNMYTFLTPICYNESVYHDNVLLDVDNRVQEIEKYFDGGDFVVNKKTVLTSEYTSGFITTVLNEQIDYTVHNNSTFRHQVISDLVVGDRYSIAGKNGTSGKLIAKIKNGVVVEIINDMSASEEHSFTVDDTFDTIVTNVDTRNEYHLYRFRQTHINRTPLIDEIDNIKESVEELNSTTHKRSISVVCFGNSFTQDSMAYVPPILKAIAKELDFTIMIAFISGSSLAKHCANFVGESQYIGNTEYAQSDYACYLFKTSDNSWSYVSELKTVDAIIDYAAWDIVTFQQVSTQAYGSWDTYFKPFIYKIHKALYSKIITNAFKTTSVKIGWLLTHGKEAENHDDDFSYSKTQWQGVVNNTQKMQSMTATDLIFPYGTAVQNLRTKAALNALGETGGLLADRTHLHEGIGCLTAAYANAIVILREAGLSRISIIGDKTGLGIDMEWVASVRVPSPHPTINTTVIGISPDNCYLAQVAAIAAVKKPFLLSFDATGESENGITLDDFITINE